MNQTLAGFILNTRHRLKKSGVRKKHWRKVIAEKYMKNTGNIRDIMIAQGENASEVFPKTWEELVKKRII